MPRFIHSSAISTTGIPTIPNRTVTPIRWRLCATMCAPVGRVIHAKRGVLVVERDKWIKKMFIWSAVMYARRGSRWLLVVKLAAISRSLSNKRKTFWSFKACWTIEESHYAMSEINICMRGHFHRLSTNDSTVKLSQIQLNLVISSSDLEAAIFFTTSFPHHRTGADYEP
jgi:hypothetical protein